MTIEKIKEILKDYITDSGLVWKEDKCLPYVNFWNGSKEIMLDGEFTADQLEAISLWMRIND